MRVESGVENGVESGIESACVVVKISFARASFYTNTTKTVDVRPNFIVYIKNCLIDRQIVLVK